jgi:hypothetical protein
MCVAKMKIGTQIAYVPLHTMGDLTHPDVEYGFVTKDCGDHHFCRFWRKGHPGELRTVANSEAAPTSLLIEYQSIRQWVVENTIKEITLNRMAL